MGTGTQPGELTFAIPHNLLQAFTAEQRFIFKPWPGLMTVDAALLKRLLEFKEFEKNFDVVIMPK